MMNETITDSTASRALLLIEADRTARADLREALDRAGFQVTLADTGTAGLESVHENRPDLVVLDLDLPDENGWEVCRQLLEADRTPLILLNSPAEATDCILGLELGADDYVAKPFHPREIAARAKSVLRRWTGRPLARRPGPRQYPGLLLDPQRYEVKVEGQSVHLTPLEFDLLWHISAVPGQVVSREELLRVVWNGRSAERSLRTVDAYIRRLRQKLRTRTAPTWRIRTIYGQGYRFEVRG